METRCGPESRLFRWHHKDVDCRPSLLSSARNATNRLTAADLVRELPLFPESK
jgi:hypothetical protein